MKTKVQLVLATIFYLPGTTLTKIQLLLQTAKYGRNLQVRGRPYISNRGTLIVGDNVRINSSRNSNPIGGGSKTFLQVLNGARLIIGNNVGISNAAITCATRIEIGNGVRIGAGVGIFDTNFHSTDANERTNRRFGASEKIATAPIKIGENVFIGTRALILKGTEIGQNSIVGAGSVVTRNIPPNEIWAGNPARKIRDIR